MAQNSPHVIVTEVPPGFLKRRIVRNHFSRFGTIIRVSIQDSYCVITFESERQARDAVLHGTIWNDMPMKIDYTPDHDPFGTNEALINEELNWFAEDPSLKQKRRITYKSDALVSETPPRKIIKGASLGDKSKSSDESKDKVKFEKSSATSRFLGIIKGKGKKVSDNSSEKHPLKSWFADGDKVRSRPLANKPLAQVTDVNSRSKEVDASNVTSIMKERMTNQGNLEEECKQKSQFPRTQKPMTKKDETSLHKPKRKALEDCIKTLKSAQEIISLQNVELEGGRNYGEKTEIFKLETVEPVSNITTAISISGDTGQISSILDKESKEASATQDSGSGILSASHTDKTLSSKYSSNETENIFGGEIKPTSELVFGNKSITHSTETAKEILAQPLFGKVTSIFKNDSKSSTEITKDCGQSLRPLEENPETGNLTSILVGKLESSSVPQAGTKPLIYSTELLKHTDSNKEPIFEIENRDISKLFKGNKNVSENYGKTVLESLQGNESKLASEDFNIFSQSKCELKSIFGGQNKIISEPLEKSESIHSLSERTTTVQDTAKVKSLFEIESKETSMQREEKPFFLSSEENESMPSKTEHSKVTSIFGGENKEVDEVRKSLPKYPLFGQVLSVFDEDHKRRSKSPAPNFCDTIDAPITKHQDFISTSVFRDKSKGSRSNKVEEKPLIIPSEPPNAAPQIIEFGKALTGDEKKQTSEEKNKPLSRSVRDVSVIPKHSDAKLLFNTQSMFTGSGIKEETIFRDKEITSKSIFGDGNKETFNLFGDKKLEPNNTLNYNRGSIFGGDPAEPIKPFTSFGDNINTKSTNLNGPKINSNVSGRFAPLVTSKPFQATSTGSFIEEGKEISQEKQTITTKSIFGDGSNIGSFIEEGKGMSKNTENSQEKLTKTSKSIVGDGSNIGSFIEEGKGMSKNTKNSQEKLSKTTKSIFDDGSNIGSFIEEGKGMSKNTENSQEKLTKTTKSIFGDGSNESINLFTDSKKEPNNAISIFGGDSAEPIKPSVSFGDAQINTKHLDTNKIKPTVGGPFEPVVVSKPFQGNTNTSSSIFNIEERKEMQKNIEKIKEKSFEKLPPQIVGEIKLSSKEPNENQSTRPSRTPDSIHSLFKFSNDNESTLKPPVGISRQDDTSCTKPLEDKYTTKLQDDLKVTTKTSDNPIYSKVAVMLKDKLDILEERDRQIRTKLEKVSKMDNTTHGICPDMCPEKERVLRELRGIVAPYESNPDGSMDHGKAIKEYARSSADQEEPLPQDLRPEPVLTMTMSYLINCIISRIDDVEDENLSNWYDFCWGRLRAIRKDIIQQQLCDENTIVILEQCARFHIVCYDRLWGTSKSQFDDKINTETLVNCLQSLMHMYEDLRKRNIVCPNEAEFKAYLILLNMNSGFLISEYKQYSHRILTSSTINEAVKIHLAYTNNMFSAYFKLAKRTSYLNACLMQRFFQHVRIQALNIMVKGFSLPNKFTNIPVKLVMDMLKIDLYEDCVSFCDSIGLAVTNDRRSFRMARNDVYAGENVFTIETSSSLVRNKRIRIAEAVAGGCLPIYLQHSIHTSFNGDGQLMEGAHDASDQEEKMLRDDLERKLAMSQLKSSSNQKHESVQHDDNVSSITEVKFDEMSTEEISEEEDIQEDVYSEYEDQIPNKSELMDVSYHESESSEETSESSNLSEINSPVSSPVFAGLPSVQNSQPASGLTPFGFQQQPSCPIFKNVFKISPPPSENIKPSLSLKSSPLVKTKLEPVFTFNTSLKSESLPFVGTDKFHSEQMRPFQPTSPKTPKHDVLLSSFQKAIQKDNREEIYMNKLRKKLSENMKKISARKYLRIWKEKTEKLKSAKEFEAMVLHNMSMEQYIKLWGKPTVKRSLNLTNRLSTRKRANIMVQFILHTDIINKVDKNVRKLGQAVVDILGKMAVKRAHIWGNIAQPNPVFWKLVISLPPPPEGGTMFTTNLKNWCKATFYQKSESVLSKAEIQASCVGVPVVTSVSVVEGTQHLTECRNLTALIVVRGRDWESTSSTENRIMKLLSLRNSPIPVAILNVGNHLDKIELTNMEGITYFQQCLWSNAAVMNEVLCNLAYNVHLYNLKVKPFSYLIEVYSEKLFDCLQQDKFLNDDLDTALTDPNNIILLYNKMIDKIEQEIIDCKVKNYYGTAFEFKEDLKKYNYSFPDNYKDENFEKSFSLRCQKCKLQPLKTDFQTTKDLVSFLRNYCDNIGCENALRKLLRILMPPNDDSIIKLADHLCSVPWLFFIEQLTKDILTSPLLTFNVVYREDVVKEIVGSHIWLEAGIIKCK